MVPQPCSFHEPRLPCAMAQPAVLAQDGGKIRMSSGNDDKVFPSHSNYATSSGSKASSFSAERLKGEILVGTELQCTSSDHWWFRLTQFEHKAARLPLIFYRRSIQWKMAFIFSFLFGGAAVGLFQLAATIMEVQVPYTISDSTIGFTIERDMKAPTFVYYDIPFMTLNHKSIVASKDDDLYSAFFPVSCDGLKEDELDQVQIRRAAWDPVFAQRLTASKQRNAANYKAFKPCGLMSLAMFMDSYELYSCDVPVAGDSKKAAREDCMAKVQNRVALNETDIALIADDVIFEERTQIENDGSVGIIDRTTKEVQPTWLTAGPMVEHYKVWMRTPVSPYVRNRWATAKDGLKAGDYVLKFAENSPWSANGFAVEEKSVVFAEGTILGSKTSLLILASNCGIACIVELIMFFILVTGPKPRRMIEERNSINQNDGKAHTDSMHTNAPDAAACTPTLA